MTKLPVLTPDDPLRGAIASARSSVGTPAVSNPEGGPSRDSDAEARAVISMAGQPVEPESSSTTSSLLAEDWSGATDVTTVRLPIEVLRAMRERARELGLPKGMILTAALLTILDLDDESLAERVETTQDRYDRARRRASRPA